MKEQIKQKLNKMKTYVKENKGKIIGYSLMIGGTIAGTVCLVSGIKSTNSKIEENNKLIIEFLNQCDKMRGDCTQYVPITGEEFAELAGSSIINTNDNKGPLFKVNGLIAFGKTIE